MDFSRPGHNLGGSGLSGGSGSKSAAAGADVKSQKGFFAKAKNSALSHIKSRVRMNIQPPTQRFSLHAQHGMEIYLSINNVGSRIWKIHIKVRHGRLT